VGKSGEEWGNNPRRIARGESELSPMFIGEYHYSLDKKGRLNIPVKLRGILSEKYEGELILSRGLDNCLFLYPLEEWASFSQKVKSLPVSKREARSFSRFLFSGAVECSLDKQGRISIPLSLRDQSGAKRDGKSIPRNLVNLLKK
jgi:MraZ protein